MEELALNILDVAMNSVKAGASQIEIEINAETARNLITVRITDDGCGMDAEFLKRVTDPFSTTRTTRKVGMGLPLFKMYAELSGGGLTVESEKGKGTEVTATFKADSVDRPPLGDLAASAVTLIGAFEGRLKLLYRVDGREYAFDTDEIKRMLDGIDIRNAEIISYVGAMIKENIENINGGIYL